MKRESLSPVNSTLFDLTEEDLKRNLRQIEGKSGFFSVDTVLLTPEDAPSSSIKKAQITVFHVLSPEAPCPCGSGEAFERCCKPLGVGRIFALNPDGKGYSPIAIYAEKWEPWDEQDILRKALNRSKRFLTAENSEVRSFWNYKGERTINGGPGLMLFGTVEMTPSFLEIATLSRARYESLRKALERTLNKTLPPGELSISLPSSAGKAKEDEISYSKPDEDRPILEEYRRLRERQRVISSRAIKELLRDELLRAARDLRMLGRGEVVVFDQEAETDLLMDYGLFEVKRHGENIIRHFIRKNPPEGETDKLIYQALENSFVSAFQIEEINSGVLILQDLIVPERKLRLVDFGPSTTATRGLILYTRLLPFPRFVMTSGWGFVVDRNEGKGDILAEYTRILRNSPEKTQVAKAILLFKKAARPFATTPALL